MPRDHAEQIARGALASRLHPSATFVSSVSLDQMFRPAGTGMTAYYNDAAMSAKPLVLEFGMGVDVHGLDSTTAACRAVSDAIRHSSLPLLQEVRERGGRMLVDVTVGVPAPASVDTERVKKELPHGEITVRAVNGGLRVPDSDTLIACVAITVSVEYPR